MVLLVVCLIEFNISKKEYGYVTYMVKLVSEVTKQKQPVNPHQFNMFDQLA